MCVGRVGRCRRCVERGKSELERAKAKQSGVVARMWPLDDEGAVESEVVDENR